MYKIIYLIFTIFLMGGCASKNELKLFHSIDNNQSNTRNHIVATTFVHSHYTSYKIKKYDRLMVNIYGDLELSIPKHGLLVDDTGRITLPVVGRLKVIGLSQTSASQKIQTAFRKYYTDIVVSAEVLNKQLFVIGDVGKPGIVPLPNERITLLRAIAHAGGFKNTANREAIYLVRKHGNRIRLTRLSLSGEASLKNAFQTLLPDDIVYIAPTSTKIINLNIVDTLKIIGAAMTPFAATKSFLE